ncbi:hypothetical protein EKE94_11610 [Mesobaculum littorinae]|uniref:L,D-TPase catalytic domain-containing protein n=1 Tax=Mesobaculum littorinae TaxID=2486419 RepID=A0A438AHB5_9RHOB|nr:L,D-transpeptidase family protein [Mesobaculum littorinae]RVV98096.1 hypothetical protein EKE94_11610 [Mesobaculum littorinae]
MSIFRWVGVFLLVALISGCGGDSKFRTYNGPEVTRVIVMKNKREMYLMHGSKKLKSYDIGLGFAPVGDKWVEGDGRTPEGTYIIDRRNPNSRYHLSVGMNYPNVIDVAQAKALGQRPGGDIFIHGQGPYYKKGAPRDWTAGCIAVTDRQMEDIYAMVKDGTPITILP